MSTGNPLEQLRRRMQPHATPTAFAALAEEHRRAGHFAEAIAVCRDGLERYPAYASARVTLGRALLDSGDVAAAVAELEHAVAQSPDNLAAARALDAARAALPTDRDGQPPPGPGLADLPLRVDEHTASIPATVLAQALAVGADGPQEFGLGPDWSLPGVPPLPPPSSAPPWAEDADTAPALVHADAPTMMFTPPHLQGDEPAGIWPVPGESMAAHGDVDGARVFSWALHPPGGEDAMTTASAPLSDPEPVSIWDAPTIDASLAETCEPRATPQPAIVSAAPVASAVPADAPAPPFLLDEPATVPTPDAPDAGADQTGEPSSFWTGLFGGEPAAGTAPPFAGWDADSLPADGPDRTPWSANGPGEPTAAWNVPDGPSATWALGDLHEAEGADATPFTRVTDPESEGPAVPCAALAERVDAPAPDVAWAGSVRSALGEVFALAGSGASLEPPTHASPIVRDAMADAAVAAAREDASAGPDVVPPGLASLQQMLDVVRARRAALFSTADS